MSSTFPYLATATIKYKSPHKQDLTFAKGETIRVIGVAPTDEADSDDDDDWLIGESLDRSRQGSFPANFVQKDDPIIEAVPVAVASAQPMEETETEPQAPLVTETAIEHAKEAVTETAGFGAPLPPRPPSDDEQEAEEEEPQQVATQPEEPKAAPAPVAAAKPEPVAEKPAPAPVEAPAAAPPPAKSPPPVVAKPAGMSSSFRDRLAAFNKPAEAAPPPLPKAKPGGWKRPAPAPGTSKPVLPGQPVAASASSVKAAPEPSASSSPPPPEPVRGGAFSAADAQSSIKMSLKERMAALQRGDQPEAPAEKPAPSAPGKIGAEKRSAALAGIGLAAPAAGLERKSSIDSNKTADSVAPPAAKEDPTDDTTAAPLAEAADDEAAPAADAEAEVAAVPEAEKEEVDDTAAEEEAVAEDKPALTEEEEEAERRAAIAKRMAALGGRHMGGGPSLFGAPAPTRSATKSSTTSNEAATEPSPVSVDQPAMAAEDAPLSPTSDMDSAPQTLAVPRRAAPPRKKRSVPSPAAPVAAEAATTEATPAQAETKDDAETAPPAAEEAAAPAIDDDESAKPQEAAAALEEEEEKKPAETLEEEPELTRGLHVAEDSEPGSAVSPGGYESEDARIKEHERQLEEYLRANELAAATPAEEAEQPDLEGENAQEENVQEEEDEPAPLRQDTVTPRPPSRPPSARPPVPKTSLPPPPAAMDDDTDGIKSPASPPPRDMASPAPSARRTSIVPPVPRTSLPPASREDRVVLPPPSAQSPPPVPRASLPPPPREESVASPPIPQSPPPVLPSAHEQQASIESVVESSGPVLAAPKPRLAMPTEDPEDDDLIEAAAERELTEEEEAAQRKAKLVQRMAALGGQRIGAPPIMGAPMPVRKKSVMQEAPEDEVAMIINSPQDERVVSPPPVLASPPPLPTSPPPLPTSPPPTGLPPLPPGRPSSTAPLGEAASTILRGDTPEGLGRRSSMRPAVPQTPLRSRDASTMEAAEPEEEEEEEADAEEEEARPATPPALPMSPPPRSPSKAPPLPTAAASEAPAEPATVPETVRSPRDLDLMPSSRWWRHGLNPLRLPPTLSGRPDAILYASTSSSGRTHTASIHMLFEDYSTTTVLLSFEDDDAEESRTWLRQEHADAPPHPNEATLKRWSDTLGAHIASKAQEILKSGQTVGDASQRALISHTLSSLPALPPVGTCYGVPVSAGAPGDVILTHNAEFKGKKGLAPYHTSHPSTLALILETEPKKNKLRALIQGGKKALEEHSFRLEDLKSGTVSIYRVAPREFVAW